MDLNELNRGNEQEGSKIELNRESISYLNDTRKWAKFLAILGFIFLGLLVLMAFSFGSIFSKLGGPAAAVPFPSFLFVGIYLIVGLIYFFPILYLYKFASFTHKGLRSKNDGEMSLAFKNLRAHYQYIGILTIIGLGMYVLVFMVILAGGLYNSLI